MATWQKGGVKVEDMRQMYERAHMYGYMWLRSAIIYSCQAESKTSDHAVWGINLS